MNERRLVELSVREFVEAVASTEHAVPAGGSVSALAGAASAALLALVASVRELAPDDVANARHLSARLLELVDEDAAAYQAFMQARKGTRQRADASLRAIRVPLDIARACGQAVALARRLEPQVSGALRPDVAAAARLAEAAAQSVLAMAQHNLAFVSDGKTRQALQQEIDAWR